MAWPLLGTTLVCKLFLCPFTFNTETRNERARIRRYLDVANKARAKRSKETLVGVEIGKEKQNVQTMATQTLPAGRKQKRDSSVRTRATQKSGKLLPSTPPGVLGPWDIHCGGSLLYFQSRKWLHLAAGQ